MRTNLFVGVGAVLATMMLAGCASTTSSAPAGSTGPGSGASAESSFPAGVYTAAIQANEITDPTLTSSAGSWRFSFSEGGVFEAARNNLPVSVGSYTATGDRVTVTYRTGGCQGIGNGTYAWSRTGATLTLRPVRDTCRPRRLILGLKPLAKL